MKHSWKPGPCAVRRRWTVGGGFLACALAFSVRVAVTETPSWEHNVDEFDATAVHPDARGFQCADFDPLARRVLFYPWGGYLSRPGRVLLAYDVDGDFASPSSYEAVDLTSTVSSDAQGFGTGFLDDQRWMYLVPFRKDIGRGVEANDLAVRYDRRKSMKNPAAYETMRLSAMSPPPPEMGWITGAAIDGRAYFVPYGRPMSKRPWFTKHGVFLRYDAGRRFDDPSAWSWVDLTSIAGDAAVGFQSCAVQGAWLYLIPFDRNLLVRYHTGRPFKSAGSYEFVDLKRLNPRAVGYTGGLVVGPYLVLVPYRDLSRRNLFTQSVGVAAAYDTRKPLDSPDAWSFIDLSRVNKHAAGYQFGWVDVNNRVHFGPTLNFRLRRPPVFVVWDSARPFSNPSSWKSFPSAGIPVSTGAAYDGRYAYLAPWGRNGDSGRISRVGPD